MKMRSVCGTICTAFATLAAALSAEAFEARQVFREERFTRGDVNLRPLQPIDEASWIWTKGADLDGGNAFPIVRFRCDFASDGTPLVFDVSADPRYVLLLDGRVVSRGKTSELKGWENVL